MSEGRRTRNIVARVIVALLFGIAMGYAIGRSLAGDAARGRALTLKEYVANFENYQHHLPTMKARSNLLLLLAVAACAPKLRTAASGDCSQPGGA